MFFYFLANLITHKISQPQDEYGGMRYVTNQNLGKILRTNTRRSSIDTHFEGVQLAVVNACHSYGAGNAYIYEKNLILFSFSPMMLYSFENKLYIIQYLHIC